MRILVTGGAGMVGSHAAEYYARKGDKVIILDNLTRSKLFHSKKESVEYNWEYLKRYKNIKRIKGDVRSVGDVQNAIGKGVDAVIHTAGQPGVPLSIRIPKEDFSINAFGTLNVLETLRKRCPNAKFVYCSTNKIYGENVDKIPLIERKTRYVYRGTFRGVHENLSMDHTGHTPYGASKYVGDMYTQEYAHIYNMKTAVFRMSCIYGIRQFGFEDQGWVAWFIVATLLKRPITIYGDGKQVRDVLYVTDLIEAYDRFIRSDLNHAVLNVGGGPNNTISLLEFLDYVKDQTGIAPKVRFDEWRPSDQKVYISDISKIKKVLNWSPQVSPREGIKKLISWIKKHKNFF